jgi:hypothetical protein
VVHTYQAILICNKNELLIIKQMSGFLGYYAELKKKSQSEKDTYCMILYCNICEPTVTIQMENGLVAARS